MSGDDRKKPDDDEDPPASEDDAADEDDDEDGDDDAPLEGVEGDDPDAPPLPRHVVERFLASKQATDVARAAVRKLVPKSEVDDLAADAIAEALRARPPRVEAALVAWLTTIARRRAAKWLAKRERRRKYEGAMPEHAAREDDYTGAAVDDDSDGLADRRTTQEEEPDERTLLDPYLRELVGDDPKELELLDIIAEHAKGKTYKAIGEARGYTAAQIYTRIQRLQAKYGARVRRRRQRMFFFKLAAGAAVLAGVAALLWYLVLRDQLTPRPPPPQPAPSASAPAAPEKRFMPANPAPP